MAKKKFIYSLLFFILLFGITAYMFFTNISIEDLEYSLHNVNYLWISLAVIFMCLYFVTQGIYMKTILKSLGEKISLLKGTYYAIVEFFYSGITPSSTGGQPAQVYYMTKDKIPMNKTIITLILNTIYFKLYLIIVSIIIAIFESDIVFTSKAFTIVFIWGLAIDGFMVLFGYLCMYQPHVIRFLLKVFNKIRFFIRKIRKIETKEEKKYINEIEKTLENYRKQTEYISEHKKVVLFGFLLTCIQRTFMFSIVFIVYKALGLHGLSYFELLALQICTQVGIDGLPLPGGTGASEGILTKKMIIMFGTSMAGAGMFLTRLFSYYLALVICMFIIIIVTNIYYKKHD